MLAKPNTRLGSAGGSVPLYAPPPLTHHYLARADNIPLNTTTHNIYTLRHTIDIPHKRRSPRHHSPDTKLSCTSTGNVHQFQTHHSTIRSRNIQPQLTLRSTVNSPNPKVLRHEPPIRRHLLQSAPAISIVATVAPVPASTRRRRGWRRRLRPCLLDRPRTTCPTRIPQH